MLAEFAQKSYKAHLCREFELKSEDIKTPELPNLRELSVSSHSVAAALYANWKEYFPWSGKHHFHA
jgi:hypothetical protein